MEIETLQIKRVTGNWGTHKTYEPLKGEYVLIDLGGTNPTKPKTLVLGTGIEGDTLDKLLSKPECVIPFKNYVDGVKTTLEGQITNLKPESGSPESITSDSSSMGDADTFAPSNHKHQITKDTVTSVLNAGANDFNYHGIRIGKDDPTESGITGNAGDIYIRYEDSV